MWEAIKEILTSDKSGFILIFISFVVFFCIFLIRKNYLKIHTSAIDIGVDEKERSIIRQQIEWSKTFIMGLYGVIINEYPDIDKLNTKYVLENIYDEVITWICFNHISKSEMYIMVKLEKIRSVVYSLDVDDRIRSEEFRKFMIEWTRIVIERLVDIREYYK